jgi:hypothetical protein
MTSPSLKHPSLHKPELSNRNPSSDTSNNSDLRTPKSSTCSSGNSSRYTKLPGGSAYPKLRLRKDATDSSKTYACTWRRQNNNVKLRCHRRADAKGDHCQVHEAWPQGHPDRYYDEKLRLNLLDPVRSFLSDFEIRILMEARRHSDGRRADQWASDASAAVVYGDSDQSFIRQMRDSA